MGFFKRLFGGDDSATATLKREIDTDKAVSTNAEGLEQLETELLHLIEELEKVVASLELPRKLNKKFEKHLAVAIGPDPLKAKVAAIEQLREMFAERQEVLRLLTVIEKNIRTQSGVGQVIRKEVKGLPR